MEGGNVLGVFVVDLEKAGARWSFIETDAWNIIGFIKQH